MDDLNVASATEVERVEYTPAPLIFLAGHPYPIKGMPTVEAVERVNALKSLLKRGRWGEAHRTFKPTPQDLMCPAAKEIANVSLVWAEILEHDQAYRFRFQDIMSETAWSLLYATPFRESKRLVGLYFQRENAFMRRQFWFLHLAPYILFPFIRMYLLKLPIHDLIKMQFDEGDRYWACQKTDYNYMGLSYWVRQKLSKVS